MTDKKPWWLSRTLWSGLATSVMAVLAAAGILPPVITDGFVDEIITAILGVLTVYYRSVATTQLTATTTEEETTNE